MVLQVFKPFPQSPTELWIDIFRLAIANIANIDDLAKVNITTLHHRPPNINNRLADFPFVEHNPKNFKKLKRWPADPDILLATRNGARLYVADCSPIRGLVRILNVNRLARQLAFESWRDVLASYEYRDCGARGCFYLGDYDIERQAHMSILDEFIDDFRACS